MTIPLLLMNLLNLLMERSDILMIGFFLGPTEAGTYAPAARVANAIALGLIAVNAWVAPLISSFHAQGRRAELRHMVRRAAQIIFAVTLPVTLVVLVFGREILGLFGPDFSSAYSALAVLASGQLVNALTGPVVFLMTMTGHQNTAAKILIFVATGNLVLNASLIPAFGIEGAAVATASSRVAWNLLMFWAVWRRLRLRATIV